MPSNRKEPTLSDPGKIAAPKRNRSGVQAEAPQTTAKGTTPRQPSSARTPPPQIIVKKQSSPMLWLTLLLALLAITGLAYGGWLFLQSQQSLNEQRQRIIDLETKLELSGDESAQSLTGLSASFKVIKQDVALVLSEIDKLWATRNVNRKASADNEQALEANQKSIAALQKSLPALEASVVTLEKSFPDLEVSLDEALQPLRRSASEQEFLLQSLRERLSEQQNILESLGSELSSNVSKNDLSQIVRQLKAHDEAIESIDKFRLTINRDLLTLKQRLRTIASPAQ
ncbi:MAG: hypothetical protein ACJA04_000201 [Cellvibrionaceae bacterium]|jgi:uncharacterized protein HemX